MSEDSKFDGDAIKRHARLVESLRDPACYPHAVGSVKTLETHISSVVLAGDCAYKLKKPLDLGFVDYTRLARRRHFCEEELRLNRRLAPDLYLDVVAITGALDAPRIAGDGEALEYAVKMRRFSQEHLLSNLSAHGKLEAGAVETVAREVARFHAGVEVAAPDTRFGRPDTVYAPMRENFEQLRPLFEDPELSSQLERIEHWTDAAYRRLKPALRERKALRFIRECHGDLHLGNMVMMGDRPLVFDGIEFNEDLRWIDVVNELAFLVMDLDARGASEFASLALNIYMHESGDYAGLALLRFYQVYRAMVRAKIACIRLKQTADDAARNHAITQYRVYAGLAARYTRPARPCVIITHGVTGSGKSTVSKSLAGALGAIWLRSDVERRRVPSDDVQESGVNCGRYAPKSREAVYDRLLQLARGIIDNAFTVVVDATFLQAAQRQRFQTLAAERGVPFIIVDVRADEAELRARVSRRQQAGNDPSEAGLDVLAQHLRTREPLTSRESRNAVLVQSGGPLPIAEIERRCRPSSQEEFEDT
ncbi:MAG: AAA family ATPase [Gammaproteobacteria bacterium]